MAINVRELRERRRRIEPPPTPRVTQPSARDWRVGGGGGGTVFPVKLEQTGGFQGGPQSRATWKYKVLDAATDELLAENVDPVVPPHNWQRPTAGWMIVATFGLAHREGSDLILDWINESVEQEACSS